jgi:hypothetical protein
LEDEENDNYIRVNIINTIIDKKIVGDLLMDQYGNYGKIKFHFKLFCFLKKKFFEFKNKNLIF